MGTDIAARLPAVEISAVETFWVSSKPSLMEKKEASLARSKANKEKDYIEWMGACALLMILPKTQRIPSFCQGTKLSQHLMLINSGMQQVLTELRNRFWIIVRNVTKAYAECRRRFTRKTGFHDGPNTQPMITVALRAFAGVGVDYGGSFVTKQGRRGRQAFVVWKCHTR